MKPLLLSLTILFVLFGCTQQYVAEPFNYAHFDRVGQTYSCDDLQRSIATHTDSLFIKDYEIKQGYSFANCRNYINTQHQKRCVNTAYELTLPINSERLIGWSQYSEICKTFTDEFISNMNDSVDFSFLEKKGFVVINNKPISANAIRVITEPLPGKHTTETWHIYYKVGSETSDSEVISIRSKERAQMIYKLLIELKETYNA